MATRSSSGSRSRTSRALTATLITTESGNPGEVANASDAAVGVVRMQIESEADTVKRGEFLNEIRYAERLCHRTARVYRRFASFLGWGALIGGSSAFLVLKTSAPGWLVTLTALIWAALHAAGQIMKPGERAALQLHDARRYSRLRTLHRASKPSTIQRELDKLRETDTPEVESMRDIAMNDVLVESGNTDKVVKLSWSQHVLRYLS